MGAKINIEGKIAIVKGVRKLTSATVDATDLRGRGSNGTCGSCSKRKNNCK